MDSGPLAPMRRPCGIGKGGYGHNYILDVFVPRLLEAGVSKECVDKMLIDNPRRQFSIVK